MASIGDDRGEPTAEGYRSLSLWLDMLPDSLDPRPSLDRDIEADVAIVGGGYTGLWTAYYLSRLKPELRVVVVERDICGFGASGRNGGWCEGGLAAGLDAYAARSSHAEAMRLFRSLFAAVDEVGKVCRVEGIDCGFVKGGAVYLARNAAQEKRQRELIESERAAGFIEDEIRSLTEDEARAYVNASEVRRGIFFAPTAAIDPARLVRGLVDAVMERGVTVYEQTAVTAIDEHLVTTATGMTVRAPVIVRATEAYTGSLPGHHRTFAPLYSLMIATEPLDRSTLDQVGLAGRPTFADDRYNVIYGQRTADDRIAFGGRGVPYLFGSKIDPATERHGPTHDLIHRTLVELFPVLADVAITHRWGGVLGAPRNWMPSVAFDRTTGHATAGGYVGEGVCAANLAGRTLADLITDTESERVSLPWVGFTSRRWEPEPIRWLGVWGTRRVMQAADRIEYGSDRESRRGLLASRLLR